MAQKPANNQFTAEELTIIHDALVFTLGCIDSREGQMQQIDRMKIVLAKVAGLIKQV